MDFTPILLVFAALVLVSQAKDVELEFHPVAPHRENATIKIICRVQKGILDYIQIQKKIGDKAYKISTNSLLENAYQDTTRYAIMSSEDPETQKREIQITINGIKGEDTGTIECTHSLLSGEDFSAQEEFTVLVAPRKVELLSYDNGTFKAVGDTLLLEQGKDHGIICRVEIEGTKDAPKVELKLGDESIIGRFTKRNETTVSPNHGLVQRRNILYYEFLTQNPNIEDDGKTVTCSAALDGFDPISASAEVKVHYGPRIDCGKPPFAELGADTEITCRLWLNPDLELASVSWTRESDKYEMDLDQKEQGRHSFSVEKDPSGGYVMTVKIAAVEEKDFGVYRFEVQNAHSPAKKKIHFKQVTATTTTTTTTTTTPLPDVPIPDQETHTPPKDTNGYDTVTVGDTKKPNSGSSTGAGNQLLASLAMILTALLVSWS